MQDVASNTTMHPGEKPITLEPLQEHKITHLLSLTTILRSTTTEPEPLPSPKPLVDLANVMVRPHQAERKMAARQLGHPNMGALNAGFAGAHAGLANHLRIPNPITLGNQQLPFDYYG